MSVRSLTLPLLVGASTFLAACWMHDALDPGRIAMADAERGGRLYRSTCAKTCHPANAFEVREVKNHRRLVATVRRYYEQVVGDETNYTQQDVYDIALYLAQKHYQFPATAP